MLVSGISCGNATKSPANGIFCSRKDTEVLQSGLGGIEMDGSSVGTLPHGQGFCRKDTVSLVSTGLPQLFTMSPVFGSGPHHKQQHGWIWFHSFSQSKQTQTALPTALVWGAAGQASSSHGHCMQGAWAGLHAPGCTFHIPPHCQGFSLHPAGGRNQPISTHGRKP